MALRASRTWLGHAQHWYFRLWLAVLVAGASAPTETQASPEVSGAYYDWKRTLKPERPWLHDYSQTLTMKIFLCSRDAEGRVDHVYLKFSDALDVIRRLDNLTLGIPKIVYLVGWQFNGHDSGYPAWSQVNEHLKRTQDPTALDSLKWLMKEARQYNTTVSLHINMHDAYQDSPLWELYDQKDVILKDRSGVPIKGIVFGGMQSYQLSYAQEWKTGLAQERIDGLLAMIPELREAGTIHIDAFYSLPEDKPEAKYSSPYLGYTVHDETVAQRKILRYWRDQGIDVTANHAIDKTREDPFAGLEPMAWGYSEEELRNLAWIGKPKRFGRFPPSLYTGTPMSAELEIKRDPVHLTGLLEQFCTHVIPWYFRNHLNATAENPGHWSFHGDIYLPSLWRPATLVAYSQKGDTKKTWRLPPRWSHRTSVVEREITTDGLGPATTLIVRSGVIMLNLRPGQGIVIETGDTHPLN